MVWILDLLSKTASAGPVLSAIVGVTEFTSYKLLDDLLWVYYSSVT